MSEKMSPRRRYAYVNSPNNQHTSVVISNAEQEEKIYSELVRTQLAAATKAHEVRLKQIADLEKAREEAEKRNDVSEVARINKSLSALKGHETRYNNQVLKIRNEAIDKAIAYESKRIDTLSIHKQLEVRKQTTKELEERRDFLDAAYGEEYAEFKKLSDKKDNLSEKDQKRLSQLEKNLEPVMLEMIEISDHIDVAKKAEKNITSLFNKLATRSEKAELSAKKASDAEENRRKKELAALKAQEKYKKLINDPNSSAEEQKAAEDELDAAQEELKDAKEEERAAKEKARREKAAADAEAKRAEVWNKMTNFSSIDKNIDAIFGNRAKMMARLQGSTEDWGKSVDAVSDAIGFSGITSSKSVITKMGELVDTGVAYNIELRAFLATTAENIASTFNAFDSTLLRLIRAQQADTTAARLGMEATLTKLFNQLFNDTSYLVDASDSISEAILNASALMPRNESLEFEYTLQKWLGSLYSLGMSSEAVQKIATGINYLGTGDISSLSNDPALQMLFGMSASRSGGKSYADILLTGLNSEETNDLLRAMIEYLAEIATSQENNVTKAAYAELFDMSVLDLSTFASLTTENINQIYDSVVDYKTLMGETQSQLLQINKRLSLTQLVNNAIENAETSVATTIGGNAFTYGMWKTLSLLTDYVGTTPVSIPLLGGFGLPTDIDLLNVAKVGMTGFGLVGSFLGALSSLTQGGPSNLNLWDFSEYNSRGTTQLAPGTTDVSYSAKIGVGGGSGSDVENVSLESTKDKAYEEGQTSQEKMQQAADAPQKIFDAIAGESTPTVLSLLQEIDDRLATDRVFYTSIIGQGTGAGAVSQISNLSTTLSTAQVTSSEGNTSSVESNKTSGTSVGSSMGGSSVSGTEEEQDIQSIITMAVEQALRNIVGYSSGTGLPVTVTNLPNGGIV